jgi:hypothetical protein
MGSTRSSALSWALRAAAGRRGGTYETRSQRMAFVIAGELGHGSDFATAFSRTPNCSRTAGMTDSIAARSGFPSALFGAIYA